MKTAEEVNMQTSFVQHSGSKVRKGEECTHYYYNRQYHKVITSQRGRGNGL